MFGIPQVRRYPWTERYSAPRYLALLETYSERRDRTPAAQRALEAGIRELIRRRGGAITIPYLAALFLARSLPT